MRRTLSVVVLAMLATVVAPQETATRIAEPETGSTTETTTVTADTAHPNNNTTTTTEQEESAQQQQHDHNNPFVQLLGPQLLQLERVNETSAQLAPHSTSTVLSSNNVIGLYFSADWCGPCQKFTPELVAFYDRIRKRLGHSLEIVWISRCRDVTAYGQFLAKMGPWYALPPQLALGERGQELMTQFRVKGIPTLVLLDGETGGIITTDGRNKIPQDRAGIGFPWRNPWSTLYRNLVPRALRTLLRTRLIAPFFDLVRSKLFRNNNNMKQQQKRSSTAATGSTAKAS